MRQWKNISSDGYALETQNKEDILKRIQELAKSYVPEWQFDTNNPDIGSVLALLFADGMEENMRRYNSLLERDYIELMNMLGISLKPAFPAHSTVLMKLSRDTVSGYKINKGMKLLGGQEGEEPYVYETAQSVYITESQIKSIFMTSSQNGKVIPVLGQFAPISYVKKENVVETEEQQEADQVENEVVAGENEGNYPFPLFDFSKEGYGKYGVLFYHPHLFDVMDNAILMEIKGAPELITDIMKGKYQLFYYGENGFQPVEELHQESLESISFRKTGKCRKVLEKGEEYSVLLLEPKEIPEKNIEVQNIGFSSVGDGRRADFVWNGNTELDGAQFAPFGETIGLYSELYIGHDEYLSKPGANITLKFQLKYEQNMIAMPKQQAEAELKIIKRKGKKDIMGAPAEVFPDEVSIEYYNGIGWRKLETFAPVRQMFGYDSSGMREISFLCPSDLKPMEAGGYNGCSIRIQVTRADNCYYQPAIHHYPVISDLKFYYSYKDRVESPSKIIGFQGSQKKDLTMTMVENQSTSLFSISKYQDTALYLGFDKKIEDGPVSLFVQIQDIEGYQGGTLSFAYSTREGFSRLKLSDHTDGFSHTGTLVFMPPMDMVKQTLEGQEAYWIRVVDEKEQLTSNSAYKPLVCNISMNAVEVDNVDTLAEEDYYIDTFGPHMQFRLNAQNILSLEVWVNEMGMYSDAEMRRMLLENQDRTKAEYTYLGEIEEFYVKWDEVDNFDHSQAGERHYIVDRMNSVLQFGDGVHVSIPRNTKGIAFKVITRRCDGQDANIAPGFIQDSMGGLLFVERMFNPMQAYGGMNMETVDAALRRGTGVLNSGNRLVSVLDYEREILNFSHQIAQAKVIANTKKDGSYVPGSISIVLLMEDYKDGAQSFLHMRQRLRNHLLDKCELSMEGSDFEIVEPLYVEVSVEAWMQVIHTDDSFEVQQEICRVLEQYLDPIGNAGWDIGRMLKPAQLELRLNMEKGKALLRKLMVTAKYQDEDGWHETDLSKLSGNPFVLVTNGVHKIHFEQGK